MENLQDIEIFHIRTVNGKMTALISFKDIGKAASGEDLNNGYGTIEVPVNLRDIQVSIRGNMLVDQSEKTETFAATVA